jgi:Holliday junction resolvase RusA-like endonuclease
MPVKMEQPALGARAGLESDLAVGDSLISPDATAPLPEIASPEPVSISLIGVPIGKGRPRGALRYGKVRFYPAAESAKYEEQVRLAAFREMRALALQPFTCAVEVELLFVFAPPPSWSEKRRLAAIAGLIPHTSRPDTDNCVKNRIVFADDAHVVRLTALKSYGPASLAVCTIRKFAQNDFSAKAQHRITFQERPEARRRRQRARLQRQRERRRR